MKIKFVAMTLAALGLTTGVHAVTLEENKLKETHWAEAQFTVSTDLDLQVQIRADQVEYNKVPYGTAVFTAMLRSSNSEHLENETVMGIGGYKGVIDQDKKTITLYANADTTNKKPLLIQAQYEGTGFDYLESNSTDKLYFLNTKPLNKGNYSNGINMVSLVNGDGTIDSGAYKLKAWAYTYTN